MPSRLRGAVRLRIAHGPGEVSSSEASGNRHRPRYRIVRSGVIAAEGLPSSQCPNILGRYTCRIMKRNVWADEQVAASVNSGFVPVTIDVDDPDAATARSRYRVGATPTTITTIITDPQGKILFQAEGGMGKTDFLELLAKRNPSADPLNP
jgi:hypothetical protein